MTPNFIIMLVAALVPLIIGFIWYHTAVFGNAWMRASGLSPDTVKKGSMALTFILTYVLSFFIAFSLNFVVIHQWHLYSIFANETGINDPSTKAGALMQELMNNYGNNFRTFKHGALHGFLSGIFYIMPVLAINAMFERKSFKYIAINTGYWAVCLMIMGGIICAFS